MSASLSESATIEARQALAEAILDCAAWLEGQGVPIPIDLAGDPKTKTENYYLRVLGKAVRDLYAGKIDEGAFIDTQIRLTEEQLARAWRGGAQDVGVAPEDMTDEDLEELQAIIDNEQEYILGFAQAILDARQNGSPIDPLLARVGIWAARYTDVYNRAKVYFGGKIKLVWSYGDTEHCPECLALNGIVAWAQEWEAAGVHPQSPPNDRITCGGWRCQCTLDPTEDKRTRNALERIRAAAR